MNTIAPSTSTPDLNLAGRRVLIAGGTGAVGEGIVRAYLAAGAEVIVPTRSPARAAEAHDLFGQDDRLHIIVDDYTTFEAAEDLAQRVTAEFGQVDDVVASIGGWWAGSALWQISETDWARVFVDLSTAHVAVVRAFLPLLSAQGAYTLVLGGSAVTPVPGSGIVSMEQAALRMMQQVLAAETGSERRVFSLTLGPVMTRHRAHGDPDWVTAEQVGTVAVAASAAPSVAGHDVPLRSQSDVVKALIGFGYPQEQA